MADTARGRLGRNHSEVDGDKVNMKKDAITIHIRKQEVTSNLDYGRHLSPISQTLIYPPQGHDHPHSWFTINLSTIITHPCNSIDITSSAVSINLFWHHISSTVTPHLFKLVFLLSCQLPVPVEKDLQIEMSWTLIDLMWTSVAVITQNSPSLWPDVAEWLAFR